MGLNDAIREQYCSMWPLVAIKLVAKVRLIKFKLAERGLIEVERATIRSKRHLGLEIGSLSLCSLQAEIQEPGSVQWSRFDLRWRFVEQHYSMNRGFLASSSMSSLFSFDSDFTCYAAGPWPIL